MKKKTIIIIAIAVFIVSSLTVLWINWQIQPGRLDDFAKCLKEKNAKFYGTFWCSYCQKQKSLFGKSAKYLPYTECSTPDGKGQMPVCKDKEFEGYPTWEFNDNSRQSGLISLEQLSEKTGCQLPE
ncbi:MAG: hypothetical protein A2312_00250 [Candidatus Staskawiczbacteria bacterium RIFOXYB2_FULL_32_9]|uniref:Thioredoxin domain-containing protein n=1 Tax=Candidatus Staskawiczbacteria bacterium RIFOXYD1_FULL_32_13 TaxID=1802234 RepID=A0A1G2JKC4_9BACT|nr:MAG: Vitamin K epoxide reductase [Parcubacteria group bacterium GW2011_GWC2_32_10]OGZ79489.1 MAG: hypothetical protein A2360_02160 [Candidatus Staskawiczbacteria bacterium RIFOXYB1_FULL_32_11]OGZ79559.1 MAG: hypothetical protein A2256_00890 [Candidatus Staskawiczbacteria bacterium RIFOXYA2_FULL_32_7]OGZ84857.1 MAG: hypothetical protein A2312_00250 [Candidatus Staskawiczbacteria bacterium RIFOXYB2_FULL_32_9]OGZ85438.1 MAG: hypothetical protein A2463_04295 [Candidatus Staskawiczbacteria bacter